MTALWWAWAWITLLALAFVIAPASAEPVPTVPYIYHLDRPAVDLPEAMAQDAASVWLDCEVRTAAMQPYGEPWNARNPSGAWGTPQMMPLHAPGMAKQGLDYNDDGDRIRYAAIMWDRSGFAPWSCKPKPGSGGNDVELGEAE